MVCYLGFPAQSFIHLLLYPLATVGGWQRTALGYRLVAMPSELVRIVYQKSKKITN